MKIGIIGPPMTGKSTLFALLTGKESAGKGALPQAPAKIPDYRLDELSAAFKPQKTTHATIEFVDFPALGAGFELDGETASRLKTCDALVVVLRAHRDVTVPWPQDPVTPDTAFSSFLGEMLLSDLCQVENLVSGKKEKQRTPEEKALLSECKELLEQELPISSRSWSEDQERILKNFAFLSARPALVAVNLDEEQLSSGEYEGRDALLSLCSASGYPVLEFCGTLEMEISLMDKSEQEAFLAEYGLSESGISRVARAAYKLLGLCSFFTVGEDEVRAWTIKEKTPARRAAGKIHSDLERGFIRAEVIGFEQLKELGFSLKAAREQGKLRLEGKDYPVTDGDIITIRFNV